MGMYTGQSSFSGWMVPRGSGITKVMNDGKVILTMGRKEKNYYENKVSARNIKWTESSRAFFKKSNKLAQKEEQIYKVEKNIRGFNLLSGDAIKTKMSKTQ